ncbi:unnamed protein product [Caenorhabditis bovis]|uniref:Phosphatidic acid phosphatase type 2/haloperoxidase domain-containing protein n=1 Tax=Caenorhabditis bovis TaxID=2654633 RepID=A0A8S1FEF2_9PELO|nr:unnamed protein product [Caenorhabditis bovis]
MASVLAVTVSLNVFKRTSSRLRPNFIDVCKPASLDQLCPLGSNAFVEDFVCTGESDAGLHFSFPSGHAAHSIFFATFIISLIHVRSKLPILAKIYLQFAIFVFTVFVCLSRVRDYRHRYVDVAGGGLLGFTIGMGLVELVIKGLDAPKYIIVDNASLQPIKSQAPSYSSIR